VREIIKRWRKLSENKKMVHNIPQVRQMITMLEEQENRISELEEVLKTVAKTRCVSYEDLAKRDLEQQAKGADDFYDYLENLENMYIPSNYISGFKEILREQSKGGAE
jgi:hemerythrin-like domain-containing protein